MANKIYEDINLTILRHFKGKKGLRVLDVGCGAGSLGGIIKSYGNYVAGVTISKEEAVIARHKLDKVFVFDVEKIKLPKLGAYDVIIFGDILEHLRDPWSVLAKFRQCLREGGRVIISVPNIATWNLRLGLLFGKFHYTKTGLMDETHIRFFTSKTAKQLVLKAGYKIIKFDVTPNVSYAFIDFIRTLFGKNNGTDPYSVNKKILSSKSYRFYKAAVLPVEMALARLWKGMFARQFVIIAVKC